MKNLTQNLDLSGYLQTCSMHDELEIVDKIRLHWSNWDLAVINLQERYKKDNLSLNFQKIRDEYNEKFLSKVILKVNGQIIEKKTIESLYDELHEKKHLSYWFSQKIEYTYEIANEESNKKTNFLHQMEWFNKKDYASYIYFNLIKNDKNIQKRSFRLNTTIRVPVFSNNSSVADSDVKGKGTIKQITHDGILLSFDKEMFKHLEKIDNVYMAFPFINWEFSKNKKLSHRLNILEDLNIDSGHKVLIPLSLVELKESYGKDILNTLDKNYNFFIPYTYMDRDHQVANTFKPILSMVEELLLIKNEIIQFLKNVA